MAPRSWPLDSRNTILGRCFRRGFLIPGGLLNPASAPRRSSLIPLPVVAGAALFFVNNFLLATLLTRLPGGTVLAFTDMMVVGFVAPRTSRLGSITVVYGTYGFLGLLGHLGVDPLAYVRELPMILGAALLYDCIVAVGRYRWSGLVLGLPLFALVVLAHGPAAAPSPAFLEAVALGFLGLAAGVLVHRRTASRTRRELWLL